MVNETEFRTAREQAKDENLIIKAVVTGVKKGSGYSEYNGLTFKVKEILKGIVALKMPSKLNIDRMDTVDFSFDEITIVDLREKIIEADRKLKDALKMYADYKNIKV